MTDTKDISNYGGVMHNSLFERSYTGNESYDYIRVLSAGGVSSCQLDKNEEPEESLLDLYKAIYSFKGANIR